MTGRNAAAFIFILFATGAAILFMMYETRRIDVSRVNQDTEQRTEDLIASLNELDYHIYWIGELPQYIDGISDHISVLNAAQANYANLPVAEADTGFTVYDEDGRVLSHIEQRDYASYMMIVINTSEELSEESLDIIQDCAVNNHVPVLLIGRHNIDAFREHMILIHREYDENSTMFFEISRTPVDNPISPETVTAGGHAYADAILGLINDSFGNPSVVYVADITTATTQETTEETTEETEDAA